MVIAIAAAFVLSGCSQQGTQSGQTVPEQVKREVKQGGQLVYGSLQEPDLLNPLLSDLVATAEVGRLLFNGLVLTDDKGAWQPDLAVSVPTVQNGGVSRDGLVVTYKLRSDVKWHDGVAFTAEDVKFTWQMIMNQGLKIHTREGYDKIAALTTPDPYTVVVQFREPYPAYLTLFPFVLPKHGFQGAADLAKAPFNRAPIGTGPFKLKEWQMAEAIVLEANPNFFRGKPLLDGIVFKFVPEAGLLLAQLKNGEIDLANNLALLQLDQIKSIDNVRAVVTPSLIWEHLDFNLDNPLFQDVRVRQAIAMGLDRQALITQNLKGTAALANADQSSLSWAYNADLTPLAHDVAAAKALLAQAGWQPGPSGILTKEGKKLAFSLAVSTDNKPREAVAQAIVQQLKDLGIEVQLRPVDKQQFFAEVLRGRRFDAALYAWMNGVDPDHLGMWHTNAVGSGGQNYAGWRNKEVDTLLEQGHRTLDMEARKPLYQKVQQIMLQEYPVVPLYYRANIDAVKSTVANYQPNPTPSGNFWNAWQWGFYR